MSDRGDKLDRAIDLLKEPVTLGVSFDRRVMSEVESGPSPRIWTQRVWAVIDWMKRGSRPLGSNASPPENSERRLYDVVFRRERIAWVSVGSSPLARSRKRA